MASLIWDQGGQLKILLCSTDAKSGYERSSCTKTTYRQGGAAAEMDQTLLSARFKGSTGSGWQKSGDNSPSFALQDVTCKYQSSENTNGPYGPDQLTCPMPMGPGAVLKLSPEPQTLPGCAGAMLGSSTAAVVPG